MRPLRLLLARRALWRPPARWIHGHGSSGSGSGAHHHAEFVPFKLRSRDALRAFRKWRSANPWGPASLGEVEVRGHYVPFFCFDTVVNTTCSADVGRERSGDRGDTVTVDWSPLQVELPRVRYSAHDPDMQVYASYDYKRDLVQCVKSSLREAVPFERVRDSALAGRFVDAFRMHKNLAKEAATARLQQHEIARARRELFSVSQHVRGLHLTFRMQVHTRVVYLPAFLVEYRYLGRKFRCFINGFTGELDGQQRQYDLVKVTSGLASVGTSILVWAQVQGLLPESIVGPLWLYMVAIPSVVGGTFMHFLPLYQNWQRERRRLAEEARDERGANNRRYAEEQEGYDHFHEEYQRKMNSARGDAAYQSHTGPTATKKHYHELGLSSPDATLDEIKQAFRKQAMLHHPDRHPADRKGGATVKFRAIVKAYQVLRDPVKRAKYDAGDEP